MVAFLAQSPHPTHGQDQSDPDKQKSDSGQIEGNPADRMHVTRVEDESRSSGAQPGMRNVPGF